MRRQRVQPAPLLPVRRLGGEGRIEVLGVAGGVAHGTCRLDLQLGDERMDARQHHVAVVQVAEDVLDEVVGQ